MNNITLLSSNPPNRDITIDIAKGIAILLVVLGHLQNPINKYIYAFHMPLFFFLSGMFVKEMSLKDTICQNGYRLLLPFIFYYLYAVLMKIGRLFLSGKFTIESLWFTNIDSVFYNIGPIWFLLSLFYIFVLWSLLSKCSIRIRYIIITLLLLIPYSSQSQNPLYFNSALLGLPFFVWDMILNNMELLIMGGILYLVLFSPEYNAVSFNKVGCFWKFFSCGLIGSFMVISLSQIILKSKSSYWTESLSRVGKCSLHIMALHLNLAVYLFNFIVLIGKPLFGNENLFNNYYVNFAVFIMVSILSYYVGNWIQKHIFNKWNI